MPDDRRPAIDAVRSTILKRLPQGYEETVRSGMIMYEVPLATCSNTYNGQPLMYAALGSQKRHMAVHLMGVYAVPELKDKFTKAWKARGTRLDMGKSCVRFKKLEQVELDLVGDVIEALPVDEFVGIMQQAHGKK